MKIIIIGASTSGLFAACLLAKGGLEVEVYERMEDLESSPRTLIVTGKLSELLGFIPEKTITNRVKYLELFSESKSATITLPSPDLIIERSKFIKLLAQMAEIAGAKIIYRHNFEKMAKFGEKVLVFFRDSVSNGVRKAVADILIGADGTTSAVGLAVSRNGHGRAALLQARVQKHDFFKEDTCKVWFFAQQTKYFFWLIPESRHMAAVGLIAEQDEAAQASLRTFLQSQRLEPFEYQSAMVSLHRFEYPGRGSNPNGSVYFLGDAAAHVKTTTVGGVVTGLYGARALAHSLLKGKDCRQGLNKLKLELDLHFLVRTVLNRFNNRNYDELVAMLKGGVKEVVESWPRDELSKFFLRLIWEEPRLISLGARVLLKSAFHRKAF